VPRHANSCGNRGAPRACAGGPATRCGARFPRHEPLACCGTRRVGATHRGSKSQPQQHRPQHQQLVAQLQRPQQLECGRFGAAIVRAAAPGASPAVGGSGAGSAWLDYSHALVRGLPASFPDSLKLHPPSVPIDMDAAARQHAEYTRLVGTLVQCGVVEVAADEGCPDCVFIEDTLLAIGPTFVATRCGAPERKPEVEPVRMAMAKLLEEMVRMERRKPAWKA